MDDREFLDDLRAQLLTAAEAGRAAVVVEPKRSPRRRLLALAAAAVIAVAVLSGVLVTRSTEPASADVEVSVDGDDFIVRLTSLETRPDEIVAEAKKAGLDVRVREEPVGPSKVGKFIGSSGDRPAEIRPIDEESEAFTGFRIRRDWPGTLDLVLGRAARGGEAWIATSDALDPDEVLGCEPLLGATTDKVSTRIDDRGLRATWFLLPVPGPVADPSGYEDWKVVSIEAVASDEVRVTATADGSWPASTGRPTFPDEC